MDDTMRRALDMAATLGEYLRHLEPGEMDMFAGQLVDEYPDQMLQLVREVAFWWPDECCEMWKEFHNGMRDGMAPITGIGQGYDFNTS